MKKQLSLLGLLFTYSALSHAAINAENGFYIGGDITTSSYTLMDGAALSTTFDYIFNTTKWGFRPYIGYHFNDNFALEAGYLSLVNDSYTPPANSDSGPDHYRLYVIDFAPKFIYPFQNGLSLFGKAGLAFVHQSVFNQSFTFTTPLVDSDANRLLPLLGIGISYNFTPKLATDFSFTHIQGNGPINNIQTLGLGLSYTF